MGTKPLLYYIERYQNGTLTQIEAATLLELLQDSEQDKQLDQLMDEQLQQWEQSQATFPEVKMRVQAAISEHILRERDMKAVPAKRKKIWLWTAAASVIALLGLGIYFHTTYNKQQPSVVVNTLNNIMAPSTNRAMITLADGSRVYLDSVGNGQLAQLGNVKLVKLANGQIAYQAADGQILKELRYNTLSNPKGSKVIDMVLSDGSRVWLNAGSSITYPVAFIGDERKVELKGEGYFEITHNPSKKFIVTANGTTTVVLGTHFNVNAYEEERETKVTLLKGLVKVSDDNKQQSVTLQPGQQAQIGKQIKIAQANLDMVMAWKNGYFNFDGLSFDQAMREIERWYNVEIQYINQIPEERFYGEFNRNTNLAGVLKVLEAYHIRFKLEGNIIYVYGK